MQSRFSTSTRLSKERHITNIKPIANSKEVVTWESAGPSNPISIRSAFNRLCRRPWDLLINPQLLRRLIDALEILHSLNFELACSLFIHNDQWMWVQLQARQRPHMVHALLETFLHSQRLVLSKDDDDNFMCGKDSGDSHCQRLARDLGNIILEKARICNDRLVGQSFDSCTWSQRRSGLVERKMAVSPNAP